MLPVRQGFTCKVLLDKVIKFYAKQDVHGKERDVDDEFKRKKMEKW